MVDHTLYETDKIQSNLEIFSTPKFMMLKFIFIK